MIGALATWILQQNDIALVPHVSPDGDAYGSTIALALGLHKLGLRARVVSDEAPVPRMYAYLPGQEYLCAPESLPFAPKAVLYMDTASPDRIGTTMPFSGLPSALLDHHATNAGFADVRAIDGGASSTGELTMELLRELRVAPDADMAVCLYTAIATDTGNFQFSNTTPRALECCADLLRAGLDTSFVSSKLFRTRTLARTALLGAALSAMRLSDDGKVAWTVVTRRMMEACAASHPDTESIVNYLNEIEGVEASAMLEEREEETKVSLRSAGRIDVARIARALGGGGHQFAAGATVQLCADDAVSRVAYLLREAVE